MAIFVERRFEMGDTDVVARFSSCLLEQCPSVAHLIGLGFLFRVRPMKCRGVPRTLMCLITQGGDCAGRNLPRHLGAARPGATPGIFAS